jgi:serine/threonine protein kinase
VSASPLPVVTGYRLGAELGRGGTGVVYAATRLSDGLEVAVKVLRPDLSADPAYRERLRAEAARARTVDHPGLVKVLDVDVENGAWLAMDRIDGPDLQRHLDEHGPLDPATAVSVLTQVSAALAALHAAGIVHRDLKPANVLLSRGGDRLQAKVTDFGVATAAATVEQTLGGSSSVDDDWLNSAPEDLAVAVGTVTYMAPEQWRGDPSTVRTDVYALGGLTYAVLTGRRPFPQRALTELAMAVAMNPPPAPSGDGAPAAFDGVVARAMAKDPEQRFTDVTEFTAALTAAGRGDTGHDRRRVARPWPITAVVLVLLALVAAGYLLLRSNEPEPSPQVSRTECAQSASLRDKPGGGGSDVGTLHRGEVVTLDHHRDSGPWSLVRTADGREGWTLNEYLRASCPSA